MSGKLEKQIGAEGNGVTNRPAKQVTNRPSKHLALNIKTWNLKCRGHNIRQLVISNRNFALMPPPPGKAAITFAFNW